MSWWATKIVVRECYVSFDPVNSEGDLPIELSTPMREITSGEPVYAIITGRPAGLVNFLMRFIGLSRRFEFVVSATQVCTRLSSTSQQLLTVSKLMGLNSVAVGLKRAIYEFIAYFILATASAAMAVYNKMQLGNGDLYRLNSSGELVEQLSSGVGAVSAADVWLYWTLAVIFLLAALYKLFIDRRYVICMSEGGENVVDFVLAPSFIERGAVTAEEVQNVGQLFRVLKNAPLGHKL